MPSGAAESADRPRLGSQTLDRGIEVLQVVVDADRPMSISEICDAASLNRSVTYRLLRTLEDRGLVTQVGGQGFQAGLGLLRLTPRITQSLVEHARPVLAELSRKTSATSLLSIADRDQEVTLLCVLPPTSGPFISFREGAAGPLGRGASSITLLALRPETPGERTEVTEARRAGPGTVVRTAGELRAGTAGLAVAWPGHPDCALAAVFFEDSVDEDDVREHLLTAARKLA